MRWHSLHDQAFILNVADVGIGSKLYLLQREKLHLQKWRGGGGGGDDTAPCTLCDFAIHTAINLLILNVADVVGPRFLQHDLGISESLQARAPGQLREKNAPASTEVWYISHSSFRTYNKHLLIACMFYLQVLKFTFRVIWSAKPSLL